MLFAFAMFVYWCYWFGAGLGVVIVLYVCLFFRFVALVLLRCLCSLLCVGFDGLVKCLFYDRFVCLLDLSLFVLVLLCSLHSVLFACRLCLFVADFVL